MTRADNLPPLRVLVWSPTGFGEHYNGPANSMKRLFARVTSRHRLHLTVVYATDRQGEMAPFVDESVRLGSSDPVPGRPIRTALQTASYMLQAIPWLVRRRRHFDAIVFATPSIHCLLPGLTARALGIRAIGRIAAAESELYDTSRLKARIGWSRRRGALLARFSGIIALSRQISTRLAELGVPPSRIYQLPNGADCNRFDVAGPAERLALREAFGVPAEAFCIVCAGRIGDRKGQGVAIEAIANLPGVHLLLAGPFDDAATEARFRSLVEQKGLRGRVHFAGQLDRVEEAYKASDAFILMSQGEGMPNAMVEAMACGLPAIGTDVSGIPDLIGNDERGFVVARDPEVVAATVKRMMADPAAHAAMGRAARAFIVANQSSDFIADRLYEILRASPGAAPIAAGR